MKGLTLGLRGLGERMLGGWVRPFLSDCCHQVAISSLSPSLDKTLVRGDRVDGSLHFTFPLLSVCQGANSLCDLMLTHNEESIDPTMPIYLSIINIICIICFNISYEKKDPKLVTIYNFTEGIMNALGDSSLVDTFPWLTVRMKPHLHFQIPPGQCPQCFWFP